MFKLSVGGGVNVEVVWYLLDDFADVSDGWLNIFFSFIWM